jgi:hypothetical protein
MKRPKRDPEREDRKAIAVSPLRKGETGDVLRMAPEDACEHDMLVGDWQYWVAQGCIL